MRKWYVFLVLGISFLFPSLALAQNEIKLKNVQVQLWPEYDQPSMLVIYDFIVDENTALPAQLTFRLPKTANIIAVAFDQNGSLINAQFAPTKKGDAQYLTITVDAVTTYHFEYYEPLNFNASVRDFIYSWPVDYDVETLTVKVQQPLDTVTFESEPGLKKTNEDTATFYVNDFTNLKAGEGFTISLKYEKSSDALTVPNSAVQTGTIDQTTEGRTPLNSYLPYILGGIGVVLIFGGLLYYFLSSRGSGRSPRRRQRVRAEVAENSITSVHCHQCGTRAKPSDRFCRTCGSRLRTGE